MSGGGVVPAARSTTPALVPVPGGPVAFTRPEAKPRGEMPPRAVPCFDWQVHGLPPI